MDLSKIYGNESAKRALEVALAGPHPLHLIGAPGTGKSKLLDIYNAEVLNLHGGCVGGGRATTTEHRSCPCGYQGSAGRECSCSPQQVERHHVGIRKTLDHLPFGLWAWTERPAASELLSEPAREGTEAVLERVVAAIARKRPSTLDDNAQRLLEAAYDRLYLSPGELRAVVEIGATIATLSGSDTIRAPHVAEAVQYRAPEGVR